MPLRKLSPREIEEFIATDKIVWVTCRNPPIPLSQGKFMKAAKPLDSGSYPYSFCSFKRGIKTGFLPAHEWLIEDADEDHQHEDTVKNVLSQMFPKD